MAVIRSRTVCFVAAIAAVLTVVLVASPSARAGIVDEAARLQDEVESLRRILPAQAADPSLAGFERRLSRLEEELRRLTGRIEELEFGQRRIQERFDQLVADLDRRLGDLEQGVSRSEETAPPDDQPALARRPAAAIAEPEESATVAPQTRAPASPEDPATAEEGTLGRVPESALLTGPRPSRESATPPERGDLSAQEQYDAAMDLLRAGDYAGAQNGLELFLELHPDHPLTANAAYWLAETHYVRKNYAAAASAFARNYRTYGKDAVKAADNLLKLGMSLEGLGETDKACLSYAELANEFPDAPAHIKQALARERQRAECI